MSEKLSDKVKGEGITAKTDDAQLSDLLDNALQDFDKSSPANAAGKSSDSSSANPKPRTAAGDYEPANLNPGEGVPLMWDSEFTRQAASEFTNMIKQLTEVQRLHSETAQQGGNPGDLEDAAFAADFAEKLSMIAQKTEKIGRAATNEELYDALGDLRSDETYANEFLPFMEGLMGNLLSKEMLYPSLKEICAKYPDWLNQNKEKVDGDQLDKYEKQLELMREVCKEYESESEADTPDTQQIRFQRIVGMLQEMQMLGQPPAEIVGDMPPGWGMDPESGVPKVTDAQVAAEGCSLM